MPPVTHHLIEYNVVCVIAALRTLREQTTQLSFHREVDRTLTIYLDIRDGGGPILKNQAGRSGYMSLWCGAAFMLQAANYQWKFLRDAFDLYGPGVTLGLVKPQL